MNSGLDAKPSKTDLREKLSAALALADGHDMPFVAIRISEAIDALDLDLDGRIGNLDL